MMSNVEYQMASQMGVFPILTTLLNLYLMSISVCTRLLRFCDYGICNICMHYYPYAICMNHYKLLLFLWSFYNICHAKCFIHAKKNPAKPVQLPV
jgi:hypothetical protein